MRFRKRCTAFIISDFIVPDFEEALRIASNKHDVVALKIFDPVEQAMPDIGLVKVLDSETGEEKWVDTSSKAVREAYRTWWNSHLASLRTYFQEMWCRQYRNENGCRLCTAAYQIV